MAGSVQTYGAKLDESSGVEQSLRAVKTHLGRVVTRVRSDDKAVTEERDASVESSSCEESERAMPHVPFTTAGARHRRRRRRGLLGATAGVAIATLVAASAWLIPAPRSSTVTMISPPTSLTSPRVPSAPALLGVASPAPAKSPVTAVPGDFGVLVSFTPESATTWWAVVESNLTSQAYVVRTTNAGQTWRDVFTPPGQGVPASSFLSTDTAWIAIVGPGTTNPPLYHTTDGGQTWRRLGADPGACQPQFVDPVHGWCVNIGAAAGSETVELYRTASGGQSWTLVSRTGFGAGAQSTPGALPFGCDKTISFTSAQVGYAALYCNGGTPYLYRSTDAGSRWQPLGRVPPLKGAPTGEGEGFDPPVVSGGNLAMVVHLGPDIAVATSANGGATWKSQLLPQPLDHWSVDLVDPTHWRMTNGTELMATNDAGANWRTWTPTVPMKSSGTYGSVDKLDFLTPQEGWAVPSPDGGPFWSTNNGGSTWVPVHISAGPYRLPR